MDEKPTLQNLRKRLDAWRSRPGHPGPGKPIPEDIWNDVLSLYPRYSLGRLRRALKLNWMSLTERAKALGHFPKARRQLPATKPSFTVARVGDLMQEKPNWQVAIVRPDGCAMTIQSDTGVDLENLMTQFCAGGR